MSRSLTARRSPDLRGSTRRGRTLRRALVLSLGLMLVLAGPASAHPFFRGGEAPVDSLATLTLDLAHGCASETDGDGDPTTEVSLQAPEWLRVVDVPDVDGWIVDLETADDGRVEVVNWTADGGEVPAPAFDLDVVAEGEVGQERFVSVFQACDDFIYRWVGTPDEPADDPAIRLTLIAADPDNPAPPIEEPDVEEPAVEDPVDEEPAVEDPVDDPVDEPVDEDPVDEPVDEDPVDDPTDEDPVDEPADEDPVEEEAAAADDDGMGAGIWVIVALVVVVVGAAVAFAATRRRNAADGSGGSAR